MYELAPIFAQQGDKYFLKASARASILSSSTLHLPQPCHPEIPRFGAPVALKCDWGKRGESLP
jgi:hypothetical protein